MYATTHRWHPTQQVQRLQDGGVRVTLRVRLCREVETWALAFGEFATVIRPDALREKVGERLTAAAARYPRRPPPVKARVGKGGVVKARGESPTRAGRARER